MREVGTAGESAASYGLVVTGSIVVFAVIAVGTISSLIGDTLPKGPGILLASAVMLLIPIWLARKVFGGLLADFREGTQFLKGADGEIAVARELRKLPDNYVVFHDFHPIERETGKAVRWNVDHVVIGPTGVFVLDAKNWRRPDVQPAATSDFTRKAVNQAQRNAMDLKNLLSRVSRGELDGLFVVPIVVFTQQGARTANPREGSVRTLPLNALVPEILRHAEGAIDQEKAGRIGLVLFNQVSIDLQSKFRSEFDAFGALSKAARYAARDARLAQGEVASAAEPLPAICPQCGGRLMRRIARKGERTGKAFLGCENWKAKNCRYIFNLED